MSIGPVEYIAIAFPGNKFSGEIIPAIQKLQESGTIRVLDLVIITRTRTATSRRSSSPTPTRSSVRCWMSSASSARTCSAKRTSRTSAAALDPNTTAGLMIWENVWAAEFAKSLRNANGILIANGRIPAELIEEATASSAS